MTDVPYPADTRAKGWRFELDHERIRQSDTWALAAPEHRPWLLMLWMVAWEQTPCGSLPDDDALIAARIGMKPAVLTKARETLMRGWWKAADGRLYHAGITAHVLGMIEKRAKESARKAGQRIGTPVPVPRDKSGTDGTSTSSTSNTEAIASVVSPKARPSKRCPESFLVTAELQRWARNAAPLVDIRTETATFRDYEFGKSCTDWAARWRVWMSKEQKRLAESSKRSSGIAAVQSMQVEKYQHQKQWTEGIFGTKQPVGFSLPTQPMEALDGLVREVDA